MSTNNIITELNWYSSTIFRTGNCERIFPLKNSLVELLGWHRNVKILKFYSAIQSCYLILNLKMSFGGLCQMSSNRLIRKLTKNHRKVFHDVFFSPFRRVQTGRSLFSFLHFLFIFARVTPKIQCLNLYWNNQATKDRIPSFKMSLHALSNFLILSTGYPLIFSMCILIKIDYSLCWIYKCGGRTYSRHRDARVLY